MHFDSLLEWFSGKSREAIVTFTIPALVESAELGYWKKGVAVRVRATLNKQNVGKKWAKCVEEELGGVDYGHPLYNGLTAMRFGSYGRAPQLLTPASLTKLQAGPYLVTQKGATQAVGKVIERWARANAEVAELVALLDSRRPKPVVVMKTLSPTVAQNITSHIGIDVSTLQYPESHGEWREVEYRGEKIHVYVVTIDWPEGTQHDKSRFSPCNSQCEACGHAIKNPYNWVPLLAYGHSDRTIPTPYSLWVGRDCAQKLFGCEVEGSALYPERQN